MTQWEEDIRKEIRNIWLQTGDRDIMTDMIVEMLQKEITKALLEKGMYINILAETNTGG